MSWNREKESMFIQILGYNKNAKKKNYENKTVNEMLAILSTYRNKYEREKKNNRKDSFRQRIELVPIENINVSLDYDTDESMESKVGRGLEYFNEYEDIIQQEEDDEER